MVLGLPRRLGFLEGPPGLHRVVIAHCLPVLGQVRLLRLPLLRRHVRLLHFREVVPRVPALPPDMDPVLVELTLPLVVVVQFLTVQLVHLPPPSY